MLPSWYWFAIVIQLWCWVSPFVFAILRADQPILYDEDLRRNVPFYALYSWRILGLSLVFIVVDFIRFLVEAQ